jgi:putative tryptophan/tyrosine transport system substrate-binding protein
MTVDMRHEATGKSRRTVFGFSLLVALFAFYGPVKAQVANKIPRIGYLTLQGKPNASEVAFMQGLRDLGYIDGQNIIIEYRRAAEKVELLPTLAEDLVRLKPQLIVARATPPVQAARNATKTIPIVMLGVADAVGTGFVPSLARPGGNITGTTNIMPELAGKRLELLREVLPKLSRVAFLAYGPDPAHTLFVREAQQAADKFAMKFQPLVLTALDEIENAFSVMTKERVEALLIQPLFASNLGQAARIAQLAVKNRLPTMTDGSGFPDAGGLMLYGPNQIHSMRRGATYVDRILKGASPADLPVQQPTNFELVINLKTAKQIGLTIPPNVLARADRVIR